jgi:hypothetical protein
MITSSRTLRRGAAALIMLIALVGLLALDLANRGLAWEVFWSLTGEEAPIAQVRGMVEWLGNLTRPMPNTEPYTPINHAGLNPYGINTFLEQEVEPAKREQQVQMIADAGFAWIRQQFPWEDIEIHARGDFSDRRNDVDGDGQIDEISAWDKYDQIVALAEAYDLSIMARLDNPPAWSHATPDVLSTTPPDDLDDFVRYAAAVAERYRGRIRYYQVWNEPNIYPEWGDQPVDPQAYTDMLCRTYAALKAVDPSIVVISGALAPTVSLTGRDLNDFIFLQRMYDAGAGACFDVLSVQGYGLNSGPTDRRMRPTTVTFARSLYIRDLMVANGDADKAIWISEAAWNPIDSPEVPADVANRENYGVVTQEQAARYMPLAYQRAQTEWPWIGVINYWFFKRPADYERDQSWYYFRMVEPDFTPLPIYESMRAHIGSAEPLLYAGVHQEDHWGIAYDSPPEQQSHADAQFERAALTANVTFTAHGTDLIARWAGAGPVTLWRGDQPLWTSADSDLTQGQHIALSLTAADHALRLTADDGQPFLLDSITVLDRSAANLYPLAAAAGALLLIALGSLILSLRRAD